MCAKVTPRLELVSMKTMRYVGFSRTYKHVAWASSHSDLYVLESVPQYESLRLDNNPAYFSWHDDNCLHRFIRNLHRSIGTLWICFRWVLNELEKIEISRPSHGKPFNNSPAIQHFQLTTGTVNVTIATTYHFLFDIRAIHWTIVNLISGRTSSFLCHTERDRHFENVFAAIRCSHFTSRSV